MTIQDFKNKNEIYKETLNYSFGEIIKVLNKVKMNDNKQSYLFNLTETLIRFLEKQDEILFFLLSSKGTCFLDNDLELHSLMGNFKKIFLNNKFNVENEEKMMLRLRMLLGSVFEVLYANKILKERNLTHEEINEINTLFWGNNIYTLN